MLRQRFVDLPFFFHSAKPFSFVAIRIKIKIRRSKVHLLDIFRLKGDHHCASAQKVCHFSKAFETRKSL